MSTHNWVPFSPTCLDCGAYRRGEDARRPCAGATDTKYQEEDQ